MSRLIACFACSILLFGGVMQVCLGSLLCGQHQYAASRQLVRLCWGYLGKCIHVPLPSCVFLRIRKEYPLPDYGRFHDVQEWLSYWAPSLALKWLLCSLTACAISDLSILDARVGNSCSGSDLSALDLVHSSITSCIRSSMYSEETRVTFLLKRVKYPVNK